MNTTDKKTPEEILDTEHWTLVNKMGIQSIHTPKFPSAYKEQAISAMVAYANQENSLRESSSERVYKYLESERKGQIIRMKSLGILIDCQTFEQAVNAVIFLAGEYKTKVKESSSPNGKGQWIELDDRMPVTIGEYDVKFYNGNVEKVGYWPLPKKYFYHGTDNLNHLIQCWWDESSSPVESDAEYWKKRCEAAENLITAMDRPYNLPDGDNEQFLLYSERNHAWQKSKSPSFIPSPKPTTENDNYKNIKK